MSFINFYGVVKCLRCGISAIGRRNPYLPYSDISYVAAAPIPLQLRWRWRSSRKAGRFSIWAVFLPLSALPPER